jgi:Galactose mutarotase and related enzymes
MSQRYRIERRTEDGIDVLALSDAGTDSVVELIPAVGNNVIRFRSGGREVLSPPSRIGALQQEKDAPFRYGTPILSPPNRVKKGIFQYNGRTYQLPLNEPPDHHLHGELCSREWEVIATGSSDEEGAFVTSRFRYADHPDILVYFPHPLRFEITCRLKDGRMELSGTIRNEGEDAAPFAFGLHPYFSIPFGQGEKIILHVPAAVEWPVSNLALVQGRPEPTELSRSLNEGVSISDYPVLGCSLLSLGGGTSDCRIQLGDYSIRYRLGPELPFLVLFRPDWSDSFSLEPYTCATDAFNLPYEPELTGAKGISPGEALSFSTLTWVEER